MAPNRTRHPSAGRGVAAASAAFLIWGLFPFYWRALQGIDAREIIGHRILWSMLLVVPLVAVRGGWSVLAAARKDGRLLARHAVSGLLLAVNWLIYVWGVNSGKIIETSLGYFLVPLLNVALGVLVLRERLQRLQLVALALAAAGVVVQVAAFGDVPWIALGLAVSWGVYSLLRKKSPLGSLDGLALETLLLVPAAAAWLLWREWQGVGSLGHVGAVATVLIVATGIVTAVPLLLFAYGARRIDLTTVGLLQYIGPSVQFTLGVAVYHEPFPANRWLSFGLIWGALLLYSINGVISVRRAARN